MEGKNLATDLTKCVIISGVWFTLRWDKWKWLKSYFIEFSRGVIWEKVAWRWLTENQSRHVSEMTGIIRNPQNLSHYISRKGKKFLPSKSIKYYQLVSFTRPFSTRGLSHQGWSCCMLWKRTKKSQPKLSEPSVRIP